MGFNFDVDSPAFWDAGEVGQELTRVFDVCHSCRRCYNLCPSFNVLLDGIDEVAGEAARLPGKTVREVVDLCYQCKLCEPHCPYVPPHRWDVDFPRLMLRAKAARVKEEGMLLPDTQVELIEKCAGVDGTWGFKKEYFHASLKVARGLLREIDLAEAEVTVSDCPL